MQTAKDGQSEIRVTFRPKVSFTESVDVTTLSMDNLFASGSRKKLDATIIPADDGTFAWLYFNRPMPGATQITVIVDGSKTLSATGNLLDALADGAPGGVLSSSFLTVSLTPLPERHLVD